MRKFIVNVNGSSYEVEVEEITGAQSAAPKAAPAPAPVAAAPAPAAAPVVAAPAPAPVVAAGGENVTSPMPGSILDVRVKVGDSVKAGDILMILEAMKMENEILAPISGNVSALNVTKGATVNSGDTLCIIG